MNLFLDDFRKPRDVLSNMQFRIGKDAEIYINLEWKIVNNFYQFVDWIEKNGLPKNVSFDHDLTDEHYDVVCSCGSNEDFPEEFNEKTGLDCAKWMIDYHIQHGGFFPNVYVHSMNPYGAENIRIYVDNYQKHFLKKL